MNESKPQPGAGSAAAAALEARIERIRQSLAAQHARLARGSRITAIIGAAVIVLIVVYFYGFYMYIQPQMTPKAIIAAAESLVMNKLPEARKAMESKINDSADEWAGDLSARVQDNIPTLRGKIEDLIVGEAGKALDKLHVVSGQRFREFINENRPMLADGFNSLKKREEAEQFVNDLHTAIKLNMSGDIREQSDDMLHALLLLNQKLDVLKEGKNLKGEQPNEREILMIAKALQTRSAEEEDESDRPRRKKRSRGTAEEAGGTDEPAAKPAADAENSAKETPKAGDAEAKPGDADAKPAAPDKPAEKPAADPEKVQ